VSYSASTCPHCRQPFAAEAAHDDCLTVDCPMCDNFCYSLFENGVCTNPCKKTDRVFPNFTADDWRDIHDALMDAASAHHSGPTADRLVVLAHKIREMKA
jgi:hypothetical protein